MKNKHFFRIVVLTLQLFILSANIQAEKRYYFVREGDLPTDVTTVDIRPESGLTKIQLDNISVNELSWYACYDKPAASWWGYTILTPSKSTIDISDIDNTWFLKIRLKTTVTYNINLVLNGMGTAKSYQLTTANLPRNGSWQVLTIPLSTYPTALSFSDKMSGKLFQLHSDGGDAGNMLAIDYIYLTNDRTGIDEGTVKPEKRYYCIKNSTSPKTSNLYTLVDYTSFFEMDSTTAWSQIAYIPFPYCISENTGTINANLKVKSNTTETIKFDEMDEKWFLKMKIKTTIKEKITLNLYSCQNKIMSYIIPDELLEASGEEWVALTLPLSRFNLQTTDYACNFGADYILININTNAVAKDMLSIAYLYFTNEAAGEDTDPIVPADPLLEKRIYFINDGSDLPANLNCIDYRIGVNSAVELLLNNHLVRNNSYPYLAANTGSSGWWSLDMRARSAVDLSMVDEEWFIVMRFKTEVTYRPINVILYAPGRLDYRLTEENFPVSKNGEWADLNIPLSAYKADIALKEYAGSANFFSLHSDNAGKEGALVAVEYFYLATTNKETSVSNTLNNKIIVNCHQGILDIQHLEGKTEISVLQLNGKVIANYLTSSSLFSTNLNLTQGIYLIEIKSVNKPKTVVKIIL